MNSTPDTSILVSSIFSFVFFSFVTILTKLDNEVLVLSATSCPFSRLPYSFTIPELTISSPFCVVVKKDLASLSNFFVGSLVIASSELFVKDNKFLNPPIIFRAVLEVTDVLRGSKILKNLSKVGDVDITGLIEVLFRTKFSRLDTILLLFYRY